MLHANGDMHGTAAVPHVSKWFLVLPFQFRVGLLARPLQRVRAFVMLICQLLVHPATPRVYRLCVQAAQPNEDVVLIDSFVGTFDWRSKRCLESHKLRTIGVQLDGPDNIIQNVSCSCPTMWSFQLWPCNPLVL